MTLQFGLFIAFLVGWVCFLVWINKVAKRKRQERIARQQGLPANYKIWVEYIKTSDQWHTVVHTEKRKYD